MHRPRDAGWVPSGSVAEMWEARETDDRGALLIIRGGVRIPRREILGRRPESLARPVQVLVTQDRTDGEVCTSCRPEAGHEGRREPHASNGGDRRKPGARSGSRFRRSRCTAWKRPYGAKDDGSSTLRCRSRLSASGAEHQFRYFKRSVRCDRIYSCVCEGSGSRYSSGLETPPQKPPREIIASSPAREPQRPAWKSDFGDRRSVRGEKIAHWPLERYRDSLGAVIM